MSLKFVGAESVFRSSFYSVHSGWYYVLPTDWMIVERNCTELYGGGLFCGLGTIERSWI